MKLEHKHIIPFLDHKLIGQYSGYGEPYTEVELIGILDEYMIKIKLDSGDDIDVIDNFKPFLYPLSMLTKEIEHNGEKFVPMERLAKLAGVVNEKLEVKIRCVRRRHLKKDMIYFVIRNKGDQTPIVRIDASEIGLIHYWIIARLLEWHFDIFGCIPANLAIEKK